MRTLLRISIPVESGNETIKSGNLPRVFENLVSRIKPEAAYFVAECGKRTALFFFDLKDPSEIPVICEPIFMELNAAIDLMPAMNPDDLRSGLSRLASG